MNLTSIYFPNLKLEFELSPSFELFGLNIHMYGIIIAFGLLMAVVYGLTRKKQFGLNEDDLLDGVLLIVPVAIIFTRAFYCIFSWSEFKDDPLSVFYIWEGGLAIYGGVIGAVLGIIAYCYFKKLKVGAVLDLTMLGFLIGQCIGRWGNFFNAEAFGCYTDGLFAMRIPYNDLLRAMPSDPSAAYMAQVELLKQKAMEGGYHGFVQVHPTFLYESLWNLVGFIVLHFLSKKRRYDGQIALGYVAWYGLGRAWIEGLRMDSLMLGPFRVSQLLAAVSCVLALGILIWQHFRYHDPAKLFVNLRAAEAAALEAEEAEAEEDDEFDEDDEEFDEDDAEEIDEVKETPEETSEKENEEKTGEDA